MALKRKSVEQIKTPSKIKKEDKDTNGVSPKGATPKKSGKKPSISLNDSVSVREEATPKKSGKKHSISVNVTVSEDATPKKSGKKHSISVSDTVEEATPKKSGKKHSISEEDTNGVSVRVEVTSKKARKHLIVEKKSDKDLFSINDVPGDVDVVENINEDEFLGSSSEDEAVDVKKEKKDSKKEEEEESDDDSDEDEADSDEAVDEKLIADDSSDEEGDVAKTKKDFGHSSVLVSATAPTKKSKIMKSISKLAVNVQRCWNVYSNTYLVTLETPEQAALLLAPLAVKVGGVPLKVSKLPFFVVLEHLPNYIKAGDVQKAVASCIEKTGIQRLIMPHINKCFVEFSTEQAFEKFIKKVSKLNISGKIVRIVPWLDKIIKEYSLRCIKVAHLPPKATVETLVRKFLEHDVKQKEIYQIKFYSRAVCSVYCKSEETEKKLLALNSKVQFEKGALYLTLCTHKVVLTGLPESTSEKKINKILVSHGIDGSKIHSIKVENVNATVEVKTKEEEQKILELESSLEIEGSTIKIVPLSIIREKAVALGLLKLPAGTTKKQVLKAIAEEGHLFNETEVEFEYGEKNSVVIISEGSEDLQQKLSSVHSITIGKSSFKVSFCKFGTGKDAISSKKSNQRKALKKKKNKKKQIKKEKKKAAEASE